ncbi:MAG: family N-acetyltransferase [Rhodospirillales bacterium]|nr:family N-acetyltransferase [Rhodospirillales bacterium]
MDGLAPTLTIVERVAELDAAAWNACAGADNPFVAHEFLHALEASGSATAETGWLPQHLALTLEGALLGVVPCFLKSHSYGEYVFDHGWAQAYERAGGRYYPKLQVAVPFTPVPGPRLLIRPDLDRAQIAPVLIDGLQALAAAHRASSVHATFLAADDAASFTAAGWLAREGVQYHWTNDGYATFDDFLGALSSSKRKAIRRERRAVAEAGVELVAVTGDEISSSHWDAFWRFYRATSDRKWGSPYLTRRFFDRLGESMADRVVLILARRNGRWIGGALNLLGSHTLFGRNWGATEDVPFLHFEACYYRAIEFAIEHGLKRVEAGAQGEHKIQRGYLPVKTRSAHWVADPRFRDALESWLEHERDAMHDERTALATLSPFRE